MMLFPIYPSINTSEIQNIWEQNSEKSQTQKKRMILPPPNITGALHLGHSYEHAIIDAITRRAELQGEKFTLIPGLDHATIATNSILEKQLRLEGTSREEIGRQEYEQRAWRWKEQCEKEQIEQMQALGLSANWERLRFTFDLKSQEETSKAFKKLWDEGYIYRAQKETFYCPTCRTTISGLETIEDGFNNFCQRCQSELRTKTTMQYFLKLKDLALKNQKILKRIKFNPTSKSGLWEKWINDLEDWCISRQQWWGHKIPLWHDAEGNYSSTFKEGLIAEEDTLDTWFTSGLWPMITHSPYEDYTMDELITGNDLLFFWALRMSILCSFFNKQPPFRTITFHGMILDQNGKKMSKTKGNSISPNLLLKEYGADALRLALLRNSQPGSDQSFTLSNLTGAKNSINKLWSIARFAKINGASWKEKQPNISNQFDKWALDELHKTHHRYDQAFNKRNFADATAALSEYTERALSSTFIPLRKNDLQGLTLNALGFIIATLIKLYYPLIPFTAETLSNLLGGTKPISETSKPETFPCKNDLENFFTILNAIKEFKNEKKIKPGRKLESNLGEYIHSKELAILLNLNLTDDELPSSLTIKGNFFQFQEQESSSKISQAKLKEQIGKLESTLSNPRFLESAPEEIIAKTRINLNRLKEQIQL